MGGADVDGDGGGFADGGEDGTGVGCCFSVRRWLVKVWERRFGEGGGLLEGGIAEDG